MSLRNYLKSRFFDETTGVWISPYTLKFSSPEVEFQYSEYQAKDNSEIIVIGIIFTTIILSLFSLTDIIVFPEQFLEIAKLRFVGFIIIVLNTIFLVKSYSNRTLELVAFLISFSVSVILLALITFGISHKAGLMYFSSITLVVSGILTIYGSVNLLHSMALVIALGVASMFIASYQIGFDFLAIYFLQFFSTTVIVGSATYLLQFSRRKLFLEREHSRELVREIEKLNRELQREALTDPLTKLRNRRAFHSIFEDRVLKAKKLSFFMIDVDNFKKYNDTYGHQAGDTVLERVAQLLSSFEKNERVYSFRLGGEEFAVLIIDGENITESAEALLQGIRDLKIEHSKNSGVGYVTASIGAVSLYPDIENRETCLDRVVNLADKQLYRAKELGRNRYCFG